MEQLQLNPTEKELYDKIQAEVIESYNVRAPNTSISKVKEETLKTFLERCWILDTQKKYISLKQEDLVKMSDSFGPDLTTVPRSRYQFLGIRSRTQPGVKRPLSAYQIFYKDHFNDPEFQTLTNTERTKKIAELWQKQKGE